MTLRKRTKQKIQDIFLCTILINRFIISIMHKHYLSDEIFLK